MKIGYSRVSTNDQNLDLQHDALKAAGIEKVFYDKVSGTKERPKLAEALEFLREGDTLIVWRLDRLGRSLKDLLEIVTGLEKRKIHFVSLTENIDTTTATGKLIFHIFASFAEFERNLIRERTNAGLTAAKARGIKGGRKPALNAEKLAMVETLLKTSKDYAAIARTTKVSERTIRRVDKGEYKKA